MSSSGIEESKRLAAFAAVDNHVKDGQVVGIGSGSTIVYAVQRLVERVKKEDIKVKCVPTSFQANQLIVENGLSLTSLEIDPVCDVAIDGADEVDGDLTLIKGGGGCLAQEKVVAENSKLFVVICDERKMSRQLGTSWQYVPIEVLPVAFTPLLLKIQEKYGGDVKLRMAKAKAGPVVTDNGNFLLDWWLPSLEDLRRKCSTSSDAQLWERVNLDLCSMAGVVDTGLFVNMAKMAFFGKLDGTVDVRVSSIKERKPRE